MPVQCRHCEDAPCAAVCPVKAITFIQNSVRLNEGLCIGCKMCALACPFGAILTGGTQPPKFDFNIGHYSYVNTPYLTESMHLRELDIRKTLSLLSWNAGQKTVAVKCDLCFFRQEGPACVQACPHQALRLVDDQAMAEIPQFMKMKEVLNIFREE